MHSNLPSLNGRWFAWPLIILLALCAAEFFLIYQLNGRFFTYTLDDAYIHLALAENIAAGRYGVNATEFSAAASSILWPFLLAPTAAFPFSLYTPLVINLVGAVTAVTVVALILRRILPRTAVVRGVLLAAFIGGGNLVGLTYTGMEHVWQVAVTAVVVWGLLIEADTGRLSGWLIAGLIVGPLLRYENLAVTVPALVVLAARGHRRWAVGVGAAVGGTLVAFSAFLVGVGLAPLPSSVLVKTTSDIPAGLQLLADLGGNRGLFTAGMALAAAVYAVYGRLSAPRRNLAYAAVAGLGLHLAVGKFGWYGRYEVYALVWGGLLLLVVAAPAIDRAARRASILTPLLLAGAGLLTAVPYLQIWLTTPTAAHQIYQQHYQMHRLAADIYGRPVAVNDLGYVAYQNEAYVLDLWGLASAEAREARLGAAPGEDAAWLAALVDARTVGMVLIYADAFDTVPADWRPVAELSLSQPPVIAAGQTVTVYATAHADDAYLTAALDRWAAALPPTVVLTRP